MKKVIKSFLAVIAVFVCIGGFIALFAVADDIEHQLLVSGGAIVALYAGYRALVALDYVKEEE